MEWEKLTEDQLDQIITDSESGIARIRAVQMAAITEKRLRKSHHLDGYRSIVDWVAARADVSHGTARRLCWTATRLIDAAVVAGDLARGETTFDRAERVARLPEQHRAGHERFDIGQLSKRVAHYRRLSPRRERMISNSGYLRFQSSSDETTTRFWGELAGLDSRIVEKAIDQKADEVVPDEDKLAVAERRALAFVALCQDSLYEEGAVEGSAPVQTTVMVDARTAAGSNGQTGTTVLGGPRIGPRALEAILCDSITEVIGIAETGKPLDLGRKTRTVSPALRRYVLQRDAGCTVEGCGSKYRLEVHHTIPFAQGGATDANDLVTLCWFHHQVAVHRRGFELYRVGASRVRLRRPT